MTREGEIILLYSKLVRPQPYSRFTSDENERKAYMAWRAEALEWSKENLDEYGKLIIQE